MSFVNAVIEYLKGGDESKVTRFHKRVVKFIDDQIEIRNREIEDIEDSMVDFDDRELDAILNVDLEQVKDLEVTKKYVQTYTDKIVDLMRDKKTELKKIEKKKEDIKYFQALKDKMNSLGNTKT